MSISILQEPHSAWGNFGAGLGQGLSQSVPSIADMIMHHRKEKKINEILGIGAHQPSFNQQLDLAANGRPLSFLDSLTPDKILALHQIDPQTASTFAPFAMAQEKNALAARQKEMEQRQKFEETEDVLGELEALKPYAGSTKIPFTSSWNAVPGGLNRKGLEKRSEIDPLALSLEGFFRDLSTKGQLPQKTFNELLKRIPKAEDSEREFQGKINGIRKILKSKSPKFAQEFDQKISQKRNVGKRPSLEEIFSEG